MLAVTHRHPEKGHQRARLIWRNFSSWKANRITKTGGEDARPDLVAVVIHAVENR